MAVRYGAEFMEVARVLAGQGLSDRAPVAPHADWLRGDQVHGAAHGRVVGTQVAAVGRVPAICPKRKAGDQGLGQFGVLGATHARPLFGDRLAEEVLIRASESDPGPPVRRLCAPQSAGGFGNVDARALIPPGVNEALAEFPALAFDPHAESLSPAFGHSLPRADALQRCGGSEPISPHLFGGVHQAPALHLFQGHQVHNSVAPQSCQERFVGDLSHGYRSGSGGRRGVLATQNTRRGRGRRNPNGSFTPDGEALVLSLPSILMSAVPALAQAERLMKEAETANRPRPEPDRQKNGGPRGAPSVLVAYASETCIGFRLLESFDVFLVERANERRTLPSGK